MSRVQRASTAAALSYVQFGLSLVIGIALIPFVLGEIGVRLYGFWLASGEVLAYAAMADFGVLAALPWMIAEADGRRDRSAMRRLICTGFCAALLVSLLYLAAAATLWQIAPAVLRLDPGERAAIAGPLALLAMVTAVVLPLRVASTTLMALQDVKFHGALGAASRLLEVTLVIALLLRGYGLYALAVAASVPSLLVVVASTLRLQAIAPDLLRGWARPSPAELARLFREGLGAWLSGWAWRLTAAADAVILAAVGGPVWVTVLAMTSKLTSILTQMSWVPGDSGLVGLANLSGEQDGLRVRAAVTALLRVYLALVTAGACVVLAVNAPFVSQWLGAELFGGMPLNILIACLMLVLTMAHGLAAVGSVLGNRLPVGLVTLAAAAVQVPLALFLARRHGIVGVPIAALVAQTLVLLPALLYVQPARAGLTARTIAVQVVLPWARRAVPLLALAGMTAPLLLELRLAVAVAAGGVVFGAALWVLRGLLLDYPPVAAMIRARLGALRLGALAGLVPAQRPPLP